MPVKTLRLRIKDRHASWLNARAREVNTVWNYCNELSQTVWRRERRFLTGFDFWPFLKGATKEGLELPVQTVQEVAEQFAVKRRAARKPRLAWRASRGARRNLGWLPFKVRTITYTSGQIRYAGKWLGLWDSYGLANYALRAGSLSEDSRGRWYLNVNVEAPEFEGPKPEVTHGNAVGIDLGLKEFACVSDGERVEASRFYRDLEPELAAAQRAKKKDRVRAIHAKIGNRRKDTLHQLSTKLVRMNGAIFVGDVDARALAKTRIAKSVLDAGWSMFRTILRYKCDRAGVWFSEVNERFTTRDCHACGARSGPAGVEGLVMRAWSCSRCGAHHDRDVNAAVNIRNRGVEAWWLDRSSGEKYSAAGEAKASESAVNEGRALHVLRPGMAVQ
jgi:IS605 OrfB family transposase